MAPGCYRRLTIEESFCLIPCPELWLGWGADGAGACAIRDAGLQRDTYSICSKAFYGAKPTTSSSRLNAVWAASTWWRSVILR